MFWHFFNTISPNSIFQITLPPCSNWPVLEISHTSSWCRLWDLFQIWRQTISKRGIYPCISWPKERNQGVSQEDLNESGIMKMNRRHLNIQIDYWVVEGKSISNFHTHTPDPGSTLWLTVNVCRESNSPGWSLFMGWE